jgi:16S rRNA U1498 N3-methylase RsmE
MKSGEVIRLADGKGKMADAVITNDHKKKTEVIIKEVSIASPPSQRNIIAISLLKNNTRLEWFLEKAAELGISKIIPLLCARTEKQYFRFDRMKSILVSAMLQSQQSWLTELSEPVSFKTFITQGNSSQGNSSQGNSSQGNSSQGNSSQESSSQGNSSQGNSSQGNSSQGNSSEGKSDHRVSANTISADSLSANEISANKVSEDVECYIAHCEETPKEPLSSPKYQNNKSKLVLIGPEGDFTPEEIKLATDNGYIPVELGKSRLRTETAGVVAATLLQVMNDYK